MKNTKMDNKKMQIDTLKQQVKTETMVILEYLCKKKITDQHSHLIKKYHLECYAKSLEQRTYPNDSCFNHNLTPN